MLEKVKVDLSYRCVLAKDNTNNNRNVTYYTYHTLSVYLCHYYAKLDIKMSSYMHEHATS